MNNSSMNIRTTCHTVIADLTSPIAVYARLRDRYSKALLLESSDFHGADDCRSFICCDPLAEFKIENGELHLSYLNEKQPPKPIKHATGFSEELSIFINSFKIESSALPKGVVNGAFGYAAWDSIEHMETLTFTKKPDPTYAIPAASFSVYRYVLAFNHFRNEVHILENIVGEEDTDDSYQEFVRAAFDSNVHLHPFSIEGAENSVLSDEEFLSLVRLCKGHIARGDVFQIVPSRRYLQAFKGDDLQVYRALRSINPSPYL